MFSVSILGQMYIVMIDADCVFYVTVDLFLIYILVFVSSLLFANITALPHVLWLIIFWYYFVTVDLRLYLLVVQILSYKQLYQEDQCVMEVVQIVVHVDVARMMTPTNQPKYIL